MHVLALEIWQTHGEVNAVKLNLGCGLDVREGWVNVDKYPWPGVVVVDVERHLPFSDETFDYILASHVLEHVIRFDETWEEIYRVLKPRGILDIRVPYGYNTDPFHIRYFDLRSVRRLLDAPLLKHGHKRSLSYRLASKPRVRFSGGFPWWHLRQHLGIDIPAILPFHARELAFKFEKAVETHPPSVEGSNPQTPMSPPITAPRR